MCCRRHSADVVCPNLFFARARAGKRKKYSTKSKPGAVSHPVTPKTKRPAMKTSAIGGSSEFHHQIVIAKLKNRDAVAKLSGI
jgi:hypothetical protein